MKTEAAMKNEGGQEDLEIIKLPYKSRKCCENWQKREKWNKIIPGERKNNDLEKYVDSLPKRQSRETINWKCDSLKAYVYLF